MQARAQVDAAIASHQAQLQQQKAQNDAIHLQVKTQGEIELAKIKAIRGNGATPLPINLAFGWIEGTSTRKPIKIDGDRHIPTEGE